MAWRPIDDVLSSEDEEDPDPRVRRMAGCSRPQKRSEVAEWNKAVSHREWGLLHPTRERKKSSA